MHNAIDLTKCSPAGSIFILILVNSLGLLVIPGYKVIFIKEIGNHFMGGKLDDHTFVPEDCTHTFIIRHPVKTLTSHIKTMVKAIEEMTQGKFITLCDHGDHLENRDLEPTLDV